MLTVLTCSWGVMPAREKCFNKYWLVSATATADRPYIQQIIVSFLLFDRRWIFWSGPCFAKNSQMWSALQWQPSPCQISLHYFYKSWLQQGWQDVDGSNGGKKSWCWWWFARWRVWLISKARYRKARQTCAHGDEDACEYEDLTKTKIKAKVVCFKVEARSGN